MDIIKKIKNRAYRINLLLCWVLLAALVLPRGVLADDPLLVVNGAHVQGSIKLNTARAIFAMRLTEWPDGKLIKVYVLNDASKEHISFSKKILKILPHQLRRAWDRNVFSGTGEAPKEVKTIEEMQTVISQTPGAIGYLPKDMINEQIKPMEVE